jgi:hypothetical protein
MLESRRQVGLLDADRKVDRLRGTRTLKANRGLFYYRAGGKADDAVELYPDGLKVVTVQGSNVT